MAEEWTSSGESTDLDLLNKADEATRNILIELQRRFRIAGRGTVTRVEQELDLGAGYFKDQRRPGRRRFDLKILFRALEALEIEPAEFFASVLGTADPVASFQAEAAMLRQRQRTPRILVLEAERGKYEFWADAEDGEAEPDLEALDTQRQEDPVPVLRRARALVLQVADPQVPELLGIYASAARMMGNADEAQIVLARALELAGDLQDPDLYGGLLLRAGDVMAAQGEVRTAHALAERASLMFSKSANLVGIGRSLIDQGIWLGALDRSPEALRAFHAALRYFPAGDGGDEGEPDPVVGRNRFSCLMSLALLHRGEGDLEAARRCLRQAGRLRHAVSDRPIARMVALSASIERQAGRHEEAENLFREAFERFQPIDPLDAALCGVELARVQLQQGKGPEAQDTAKAMLALVEPLDKNPAAAKALAELLRRALAGSEGTGKGLTVSLLRRVARGLEAGRTRSGSRHRRSSED